MIDYAKLRSELQNVMEEAGIEREIASAKTEKIITEIYRENFRARVTAPSEDRKLVFEKIFRDGFMPKI